MTTKDIKYWLEEKELKTPEHDEMVLWCFNNFLKIFEEMDKKGWIKLNSPEKECKYYNVPYYGWDNKDCVFSFNETEYTKRIKELTLLIKEKEERIKDKAWESQREYFKTQIQEFQKELELRQDEFKILPDIKELVEKDWEGFMMGFTNLLYTEERYKFNKFLEYHLSADNGWNIGFVDLMVICSYNSLLETKYFSERKIEDVYSDKYFPIGTYRQIYLEIKPQIKSMGEVMRQIKFYKTYVPKDSIFVLITKTKGFKEIFESQGIYVYEYKEGQTIL